MGNYLYRVVYWNGGNRDGIALIYAANEADALAIYAEQRSNIVTSVTLMTGGFTPGTFVRGDRVERAYLPPTPVRSCVSGNHRIGSISNQHAIRHVSREPLYRRIALTRRGVQPSRGSGDWYAGLPELQRLNRSCVDQYN